ncbi:Coenzyme F420 hydrogenase/dehydrogenase, beta subunit C-terminal domain [Arthrobacter sp. H35-D1]|uniref:Coenzyme F420 hydrogenase/dehydrogenase, beta subunit C-terminal domain n=1 Tax=Arthrobacter sp. H35-D1 TaxID=3046202 RepID=UPI0024B9E2E3|nr:Coenzyme F420 hydrogenase/dehydrogenase, beta subunit C-terminal domain [Arthrobacter sp. H35-D1]MDJ0312333.1 Coenzyme F420 hydrogenase/dehydrogenase, beta subunit C-terminal domain [Arthrobacter sp. H35-D1]
MTSESGLDAAIERVVHAGNCSGCGACALLDEGLRMELDDEGYMRPVRHRPPESPTSGSGTVKAFGRACPGVRVSAQRPRGSRRDAQLGPVVQAWEAWSADPEIRHKGSSGGTLTALSAWLLQAGHSTRVIGAQGDPQNARRTVTVRITSKAEALASSGSRYAPVSNAAHKEALAPGTSFIGKPCEVSALRGLSKGTTDGAKSPILLSFFCAGTPSQNSTGQLAEKLGVSEGEDIVDLRYRGNGWPGEFSITRNDGSTKTTSYEESWGKYLGPTTQWRCKICPDGIGESADITAGDFWRTDAQGYPLFADQAGISALIARTERGRDLVLEAAAAGILILAPLDLKALATVQPLQRKRRSTLFARLVGVVAAGGKIPRFEGFGLFRMSLPEPRESWRTAKGAYRRRKNMRL